MIAIRLNGMGGYDPGTIDLRRERELNAGEWDHIEQALQAAKFDTLPQTETTLGADGAKWILESAKSGKYRLIERWSPDAVGRDAEFRRACEAILEVAGTDLVTGPRY
jgi:hypothetical protein